MAGLPPVGVELVAVAGPSASGTSHSFSNVSFGPDFTGRFLFVFIFGQGKPSASTPGTVTIGSWLVGGVGPYGGGSFGFYFRSGGSGSTVFCGVVDGGFNPTGTSGTISFTTSMATQCSLAVLAAASVVNPNATLPNSVNGNNANSTSVSAAVDLPSLATLMSGGIVNDSGVTTSFTNATKLTSFEHVAGYQCAAAASYALGPQTGRSVTFSTSGASKAMAIDVDVWQ